MANDKRHQDKHSHFEGLSFEEQTYAYARQWVLTRRTMLKSAFALGAAGFASSIPTGASFAQSRGGNLVVARADGSDTMDPHKAGLISSSEVQTHIFDPLAVLDAGTGEVHPGLALNWKFENDNKTVVFNLRPNVRFHDGTPFNAQAVEATVKRHLDPATKSRNKIMLGPVDHVEALDDMTVAYHYKQPYIAIWAGFFLPYTSPISPAAVEKHGDKFGRNPVGTGPFKFVSWDANDTIRLERNEDRNWNSPAYENEGQSYVDSVEYRTVPEPSTRMAALLSGEANLIAGAGDAVPNDKIDQLKRTSGIKVVSQPALGVYAYTIVRSKPPMDDLKVRQAISHAINREKVLALAFAGAGKVAHSPLASSFPNYNEAVESMGYKFDPDRAKQLLAEAGHADGLELSVLSTDAATARAIAEIVQADLANVGVKLNIQTVPGAEFSGLRRNGTTHLVFTNYSFVEPTILRSLLSNNAGLNFSASEHARLDELASAEVKEFDPEKRQKIHYEMQQIVVEEALWIPMVEGLRVAAMRENVHISLKADGTVIMNDVWIDG